MSEKFKWWLFLLSFCILFWLIVGFFVHKAFGADVGLNWTPNSIEDQVRRYNVCWSNYSGNTKTFKFLNCSSTTKPPKVITDISQGSKYYFRINATNDFITSLWSNFVYVNFVRTPVALKFQSIEVR